MVSKQRQNDRNLLISENAGLVQTEKSQTFGKINRGQERNYAILGETFGKKHVNSSNGNLILAVWIIG